MDEQILDLLNLGCRALFLGLVPLLVVVGVAGVLGALAESVLGIFDSGINYGLKVVAFGVVAALLGGVFLQSLTELALRAF